MHPAELLSITSRSDPLLRLNSICPYYTMFPISFPLEHLGGAQAGDWVLDPFCGRGTTNFAARLLGLPSIGVDNSPVATAIAAAKLVHATPEEIIDEAEQILATEPLTEPVPQGPFWELAFHPDTLADLCRIRQSLLRTRPSPLVKGPGLPGGAGTSPSPEPPSRTALRALILGILHGPRNRLTRSYLSNQMPRTYATKPEAAVRFWRRRGLHPEYVDVLGLIRRRAEFTFAQLPPQTPGQVLEADSHGPGLYDTLAETTPPFRWVVTSPPYYGMRFYVSDQWLRNWFVGGPPAVDYGFNGQIGSTSFDTYLDALGDVWRRVARVCTPDARLIVRMGSMPSMAPEEPESLVQTSFDRAGGAWRILSIRGAGRPSRQRRQAEQFARPGTAPEEVDLIATRC